MSKRKFKEIATNPSGHVGVYRASNAKGWKAYVMGKDDVVLLGIYPTIRAAVAARAKYWKAREGKRLPSARPSGARVHAHVR